MIVVLIDRLVDLFIDCLSDLLIGNNSDRLTFSVKWQNVINVNK